MDDVSHLGRGCLVEAIVRVCVSRMDRKAYERGKMLSILVVGSEMAKVFKEGKENILRIYLRIRHTTANGVENL